MLKLGFLSVVLAPVWSAALLAQQTDPGFEGSIPNTVVFGGSLDDYADAAFVDSAGYISVIGRSYSEEFLGLPPDGQEYGFVARFRPDGTRLSVNVIPVASQSGTPCAVDSSGNLYSASFGPVTKLSPDGSTTLYSLPLGGSPAAITVDGNGRAYVAFSTSDAWYVGRISAAGDRIEQQVAFAPASGGLSISMALDPGGTVYLAGSTQWNLPATPGVLRQSCNANTGSCGFVVKIPASMDKVEYATLLRGGNWTNIFSIAADKNGNAYVAGDYSYIDGSDSDIPSSAGPNWPPLGPNPTVAFVAKLNPTASALVETHVIGPGSARAVALDPDGSILAAAQLYFGGQGVGLWRFSPSSAQPELLSRIPARLPNLIPGAYNSVRIAVDQAGNRFLAASVTGGFPRTDLGWPQDAVLVKVPAKPAQAHLTVTVDVPPTWEYEQILNGADMGLGHYVGHFILKNNGPDPAGPLWLRAGTTGVLLVDDYALDGTGARDGAGFRIRELAAGAEAQFELKYGARDVGGNANSVWEDVLSATADPAAGGTSAAILVQPGSGGTVVNVSTDPGIPLQYFRSDIVGTLTSTLAPHATTYGKTVSVWFPPVQYATGIAWEFKGWSDGSRDPVKTVTTNGGTVQLVAKVAPRLPAEANPPVVYFVSIAGSAPAPKDVTITATWAGQYAVSPPAVPWLSASPTSGWGNPVTVAVNVAGLAPGEYRSSLQVSVTGSGALGSGPAAITIPVVLRVLAQAPQLSADRIVDAASHAPGLVVPEQLLAIFSAGAGPSEPVVADTTWNTGEFGSVGGIDVCVMGYPPQTAKVLYAAANQLNVALPDPTAPDSGRAGVVCPPYDGNADRRLALVVDGREISSAPISFAMGGASIFTLDMSGVGNAVALNADGSVNWAGNPAKQGDLVHLYVTAGGGYPSQLPAAVEIAGEEADILRISQPEDPGQNLPGLQVVDVFIPNDAHGGPSAPVLFELIGGNDNEFTSQQGVTLAIRENPAGNGRAEKSSYGRPLPRRSGSGSPSEGSWEVLSPPILHVFPWGP